MQGRDHYNVFGVVGIITGKQITMKKNEEIKAIEIDPEEYLTKQFEQLTPNTKANCATYQVPLQHCFIIAQYHPIKALIPLDYAGQRHKEYTHT